MHVLLKAQERHNGVWGQLAGVRVSHTGITGAGKHMALVLPPGVDTGVPYLQEETSLDAVQDAVSVLNLV